MSVPSDDGPIAKMARWMLDRRGFSYDECSAVEQERALWDAEAHLSEAAGLAHDPLRAEVERLRQAILNLDKRSVPLGEDESGWSSIGYFVPIGVLHRALGVVGHNERVRDGGYVELEHYVGRLTEDALRAIGKLPEQLLAQMDEAREWFATAPIAVGNRDTYAKKSTAPAWMRAATNDDREDDDGD